MGRAKRNPPAIWQFACFSFAGMRLVPLAFGSANGGFHSAALRSTHPTNKLQADLMAGTIQSRLKIRYCLTLKRGREQTIQYSS